MTRAIAKIALAAVAVGAAVLAQGMPAADAGITPTRDLAYAGPGGPRLDVQLPPGGPSAGRPAVLLVHGGAWTHGSRAKMSAIAGRLAEAGFVTFNVGYTLAAPGNPGHPAQLRELRTAVRWIRARAARFGVDPERIGALGSSAGGHLVALLATTGRGDLGRGGRIRAAVTWSAPLDLPRLARHWLRGSVRALVGCRCMARWAAASPLAHVSADDPPMLLVSSRREIVPAAQARRMARALRLARVEHRLRLLDGTAHARLYAAVALPETIAFLRSRLG